MEYSFRSGRALLTCREIVDETERNWSVFRIQPAVSEEGSLILCVELVHQGLNPAFLLPINARQVVDDTNTVLSQTSARLSEHNSYALPDNIRKCATLSGVKISLKAHV